MNLQELEEELNTLNRSITGILRATGFSKWDNLEEVEADTDNPEDNLLLEEYRGILEKLDRVNRTLDYLKRPIRTEGRLQKQENGRYSLGDSELTSGSGLEVLVYDESIDRYKWLASRLEHNGQDYYIVGYSGTINGLKARQRK